MIAEGLEGGREGRLVHDHSELWRTRRCVPERGFLTTIQNMMDVAKLSAYLYTLAKTIARAIREARGRGAYHVKMYCVWLFLKFTVGARPIGTPLGSRS